MVLGHVQLSNDVRLVKLRNPWGYEKYHGDWSDESSLWTDDLKTEAGWELADDGIFFMSIEDYWDQVEETYLSTDTTGWYSDYYLSLNDSVTDQPGSYDRFCGSECTRHLLTLSTDVE